MSATYLVGFADVTGIVMCRLLQSTWAGDKVRTGCAADHSPNFYCCGNGRVEI